MLAKKPQNPITNAVSVDPAGLFYQRLNRNPYFIQAFFIIKRPSFHKNISNLTLHHNIKIPPYGRCNLGIGIQS